MQNLQWLRVYRLFVAGLLIGAFGVYFFGNVSTSWTSGFGVQSYEWEGADLPSQWVIVDAEAFDLQCSGDMCVDGCVQRGIAPVQCKDMCKGKCEDFIDSIKDEDMQDAANEAEAWFTFRGINSAGTVTKADASIKKAKEIQKQWVRINEAKFIYEIDGQRYDEECVAMSCFQLCRNKGATEERCKPICAGKIEWGAMSECHRLKSEDRLEFNRIK